MKPHPILRTVLIKKFSIFSNVQILSVVPSRVVFYVIWVNVFCDIVERCPPSLSTLKRRLKIAIAFIIIIIIIIIIEIFHLLIQKTVNYIKPYMPYFMYDFIIDSFLMGSLEPTNDQLLT